MAISAGGYNISCSGTNCGHYTCSNRKPGSFSSKVHKKMFPIKVSLNSSCVFVKAPKEDKLPFTANVSFPFVFILPLIFIVVT